MFQQGNNNYYHRRRGPLNPRGGAMRTLVLINILQLMIGSCVQWMNSMIVVVLCMYHLNHLLPVMMEELNGVHMGPNRAPNQIQRNRGNDEGRDMECPSMNRGYNSKGTTSSYRSHPGPVYRESSLDRDDDRIPRHRNRDSYHRDDGSRSPNSNTVRRPPLDDRSPVNRRNVDDRRHSSNNHHYVDRHHSPNDGHNNYRSSNDHSPACNQRRPLDRQSPEPYSPRGGHDMNNYRRGRSIEDPHPRDYCRYRCCIYPFCI